MEQCTFSSSGFVTVCGRHRVSWKDGRNYLKGIATQVGVELLEGMNLFMRCKLITNSVCNGCCQGDLRSLSTRRSLKNLSKGIRQISNWIFYYLCRKPQNKEPQPKPGLFTNPWSVEMLFFLTSTFQVCKMMLEHINLNKLKWEFYPYKVIMACQFV